MPLFADNPMTKWASMLKTWQGPAKALLIAIAIIAFLIWSSGHSIGGQEMKQRSKKGWTAAAIGVFVGFGAVAILNWISQQGATL